MTYKTILASFQDAAHAPQMIEFATALASEQDAHLTGLYVIPTIRPIAMAGPAPVQMATDLLEVQRQHFAAIAEETEAKFISAAEAAGIIFEWRCVDAHNALLADVVVQHARGADISVVGQPAPDDEWEPWAEIPERLLMDSGRPVVVVPYAGKHGAKAKQVMLAWNGTKEAARATFDAMPFLQAAETVKVLSVNLGQKGDEYGFTPGDEIATNLSRHNVNAVTARSINPGISIGDELLSRAADTGTNLLVMGGYGHSKMYESLFGGATRHILKHMTMPVLMAH